MRDVDKDVRSGPDRYINVDGIDKELPNFLHDYERPVIITGQKSAAAFAEHTGIDVEDLPGTVLRYDGSATVRNATELAVKARGARADVIVGIGAGKLTDTAKNTAEFTKTELILVPTLAATCSGYSALSVNYDDNHRYANSPMHPRNSVLALVDPGLIAKGPIEFLRGGVGDTLAKLYESEPVFARMSHLAPTDRLGLQSAKLIDTILREESVGALADAETHAATPRLTAVIDTIIALGGTVGGFAGVKARATGAHSINDALTYVPGTKSIIHGLKVAYGILVQLQVEGKSDTIAGLRDFYKAAGLPLSLRDMGVEPNEENLSTIATYAVGLKHRFKQAVPSVTAERVRAALNDIEGITA